MLNPILQNQLDKYLGEEKVRVKYKKLLNAISRTYDRQEKSHRMLDKYINLGSGRLLDINTKLQAESKKLKETEEEVKTLFKNIDAVFFSVDMLSFKVTQMSEACKKVYGYSQSEFFNNINLWQEVIYPEDRYMLFSHNDELAKGKNLFYQYRIIHKDKSIRWIDAKVIPSLDASGKLIRIDGIVTDTTEKKIAEQKLTQTENLLNEAQKMAKMGNWNRDLITGELYISDTLREMLGIEKKHRPDARIFVSLVHPEDRERVDEEIKRLLTTGNMVDITYRINRMNDKKEIAIHSVMYVEKNEAGKMVRIYGMSQDISIRKRNESRIEQLNMLIYQISHDLKGPLNSVKNYIYLALKRVSDRTAQNYLAKIQDSYEQMEQRILSLLDLQRMNRAKLNYEKIDISSLLNCVLSSIDGVQGFNSVAINTNINLNKAYFGDRQFLHSILHNLISNAVNYRRMVEDSYINIDMHDNDNTIVISIADNGQGIPLEQQARLFEQFGKGENSNGTGLGLYIVKNLVLRLAGDINFSSEPGKGTKFTITLPLTETTGKEVVATETAYSKAV